MRKELEPSRLGKHLSDNLTRSLVMGILCMLMVLPQISYDGQNFTGLSGLRELFWFGRSKCKRDPSSTEKVSFCGNIGDEDWITENGWFEKLRQYVSS